MSTALHIIIDRDPGCDDALALMLLWLSQQVTVEAVTTVAGHSTIENVTRNARAILDLMRCPLPVYSGAREPLARELNGKCPRQGRTGRLGRVGVLG